MATDDAGRAAAPAPGLLGRCRDAAATGLRETREAWPGLSAYERFEQVVALVVSALVSVLIAAALVHLTLDILLLVVLGLADPAEKEVFQAAFGMVITVLIALEFNHSILGVLERRHGVVQVRTVVLIALLALVRKFIVLDATRVEALTLVGLAAAVLALGAVYWLVRDQDRRDAAGEEDAPGADGEMASGMPPGGNRRG